jgi:hypothetical protein
MDTLSLPFSSTMRRCGFTAVPARNRSSSAEEALRAGWLGRRFGRGFPRSGCLERSRPGA